MNVDKKTVLDLLGAYSGTPAHPTIFKSNLYSITTLNLEWRKQPLYSYSYGFPTSITSSSTTVATTVTHLNNQNYNICMRRASGYCYICYSTLSAGTDPQAFGLSYVF